MAPQRRALGALPEDPDLVTSTYVSADNHLELQFQGSNVLSCSLWAHGTQAYMQARCTYKVKKKKSF